MSAAIDLLQREIAGLKKVLNARDRGIPSQLGVMVKGDAAKTPESRAEAVKRALAPYGIETIEDARAAGCDVRVVCLAWLREDVRNIPKPTWPIESAGAPKIEGESGATNTESVVPNTGPKAGSGSGAVFQAEEEGAL